MTLTYALLGLMLLVGSVYACLFRQQQTPLPQEVILERLNQRR